MAKHNKFPFRVDLFWRGHGGAVLQPLDVRIASLNFLVLVVNRVTGWLRRRRVDGAAVQPTVPGHAAVHIAHDAAVVVNRAWKTEHRVRHHADAKVGPANAFVVNVHE